MFHSACEKYTSRFWNLIMQNVLYCDDCYNLVTAARCAECNGLILGKERLEAMGRFYHPVRHFKPDLDSFLQRHLVCFNCKSHLIKNFFIKKLISYKEELGNRGFCVTCATNINNSLCSKCNKPLNDSVGVVVVYECSWSSMERATCIWTVKMLLHGLLDLLLTRRRVQVLRRNLHLARLVLQRYHLYCRIINRIPRRSCESHKNKRISLLGITACWTQKTQIRKTWKLNNRL